MQFLNPSTERTVESVRREFTPWERHLMGQPFLHDFMPTSGVIPDDAVKNFMACLQDWIEEESRLRKIWRPS